MKVSNSDVVILTTVLVVGNLVYGAFVGSLVVFGILPSIYQIVAVLLLGGVSWVSRQGVGHE